MWAPSRLPTKSYDFAGAPFCGPMCHRPLQAVGVWGPLCGRGAALMAPFHGAEGPYYVIAKPFRRMVVAISPLFLV